MCVCMCERERGNGGSNVQIITGVLKNLEENALVSMDVVSCVLDGTHMTRI